MARIRSVKPEFWDDRKLAKRVSRDGRLLYIALWNLADEHCRLNGDPQWIKGQVFSYDDDLDAAAVEKMLEELATPAVGAVQPYEVDGDPYLFLPKMAKHQRLEPEKVKSRLPEPPAPGLSESESNATSSEPGASESAPGADSPESGAGKSSLLYGAGGREQVAGGRGSRGARETPATLLGNSLLDEHIKQCRASPPRDVVGALGERIDRLLDEGQDPANIRRALAALRLKTNLGPGALPTLVHEILQGGSPDKPGRPRGRNGHAPYQDPPDDSVYEGKIA